MATQANKPAPAGYMIQLDGLRALAALAVVAWHTLPQSYFPKLLGEWKPWIGVRLFFVLSGFLITGILLRSRDQVAWSEVGLRRAFSIFYARRFLRIFPLYYLALFTATIAGLPDVRRDFFWHLTYLSNFLVCKLGDFPKTLGHFWTLGVEEQFYLLWPAFILLAPRRWLFPTFVATFILANIAYAVVLRTTCNWTIALVATPPNLDALVVGAMLALLRHEGQDARLRRFVRLAVAIGVVFGVAGFGLGALGKGWAVKLTLSHASNALIFAWLVEGAARGFGGVAGRLLSARPLVYLGTISYGIYIYHELIGPMLKAISSISGVRIPWPEEEGPWKFACTTTVAVAVASLSWRFFEKPLNDLKRYFPYRGDAQPVARRREFEPAIPIAGAIFDSTNPDR